MLKTNIFTSLFLILSTLLLVTARSDYRSRAILHRSPTPTAPEEAAHWTNAKRLAAGLTPRKPSFAPTRIVTARDRPRTSGTPEKKCWIYLDRVGSGSWDDKYISKDYVSGKKYFGVESSSNKRMVVTFTPSSSGPVNLEIDTNSAYPYLGFAGETLGTSSVFYMTDTDPTSPGSTPQSVGNGLAPGTPKSESAIWFYSSSSGQFTVQWVQPNGSIVTPKFWYFPSQQTVGLVRNTQSSGWEVKMYCDPYDSY